MKGRNKPVIRPDAIHHIYQNTRHGHLIFYSVKDYLVFLSVVSLSARRNDVQVLGICMMLDHIHLLVKVHDPRQLISFVRDYTSRFTRLHNDYYQRQGALLNPYGCAPKIGHKRIRSGIAYLYNNPVENHLVLRAEEDRWNLLAYAANRYPFSEKVRMDYARWELRKALYEVKASRQGGRILEYAQLERITRHLSPRELQQFIDYTIWKYNPVDYQAVICFYGSYEEMLTAINSNTGSEYDLKEDAFAKDHRIYKQMIHYLVIHGRWLSMKEVLDLPEDGRKQLAIQLIRQLGATEREADKLLRL